MHTQNSEPKTAVTVVAVASDQSQVYEMRIKGVWHPCRQGTEMAKGWLEFLTPEGKKGLAPFGTWRRVAPRS